MISNCFDVYFTWILSITGIDARIGQKSNIKVRDQKIQVPLPWSGESSLPCFRCLQLWVGTGAVCNMSGGIQRKPGASFYYASPLPWRKEYCFGPISSSLWNLILDQFFLPFHLGFWYLANRCIAIWRCAFYHLDLYMILYIELNVKLLVKLSKSCLYYIFLIISPWILIFGI